MSTNLKIWRESASLIIAAKSNFSQSHLFNYKVLCLQRSGKSGILPNVYVFPGGNISKSDGNIRWLQIFEKFGHKLDSFKQLYPKENIPPILNNTDKNCLPRYLSLRICAIRETFEECGILICKSGKVNYTHNSSTWASYIGGHEILKWQHRVHDNPNEFLNLCSQFELYPDVWSLKNWSNWMTPPAIPIRFDTMFFFSTFNQMPDVHREENEIQNIKWATPDEYIVLNSNEKIMLPVPQFYEISRIRNFNDINTLSEHTSKRSCYGCEKYFPYRVNSKEGLYTIFPGDDMYPKSIDKENINVEFIKELPICQVQNRLLMNGDYHKKIFIKNFTPKDKHLPPLIST
ncbi:nucleoside diphosphate-linked moiety X motif 19-like [Anoplophora glabripennis]|uniref:nucleoside diphosphate-linked moiety X motif 19-like n=1 Tax=Anoplophora glabripennis TaxID=217634 RepID=UPI000873A46A|nr:nucleoside diphosphate-linked moiety X motif 19-like [Anoplophora glabripennis]